MKIAIISMIRDAWGGSEELWYDMAKVALPKGYEVLHLSYEHKPLHPKLNELISLGLREYHRPSISNQVKGLNRLIKLSINYLRKKINSPIRKLFGQNPDVIIYNGTCYSITDEKQILHALKNFNGEFFLIGHFNENRSLTSSDIATIIKSYQKATKVFFTNYRDIKAAEMGLDYKIPNAKVIRNPVNMKDKTIIPFPQSHTIEMAMVGNLVIIHKGQDIVLNILRKEDWKNKSWRLNIYGTGNDESLLKEMAAKFGLNEKVVFHGKVNDIRTIWQKNHILLMPSRMEGMPLAVVEAMLCGRPCIVTDVGGHIEWVNENLEGWIADKPNIESFEAAMNKGWAQKQYWDMVGRQAHKKALSLYDPNPGKTLLGFVENSLKK